LRCSPTTLFAAAVAFALAGPAAAAPNSINDCEKIDAADAYNQCLALFGPAAHTHGASAKDFGGDGVGGGAAAAAAEEKANPEASVPVASSQASRGRRGHVASRGRHQRYGHYYGRHGQKYASAHARHGGKRLAFNVVSGHSRKR
jgi:hypothetical protein